jgi:hypothetical protein
MFIGIPGDGEEHDDDRDPWKYGTKFLGSEYGIDQSLYTEPAEESVQSIGDGSTPMRHRR